MQAPFRTDVPGSKNVPGGYAVTLGRGFGARSLCGSRVLDICGLITRRNEYHAVVVRSGIP